MSYLVLARKWRPQTFTDLVGQEHVAQTLRNAIAQNRLAHAFLFTGARGVGKTTIARVLAKALNCLSATGPTADPCGRCDACVEIARSGDVDVKEIDGASNNSVDDVRKLQETLPYLPARDRFKVVIIDEVHMLSTGAFNALLKTLEEPPPHVKFVFATTEVHKVPITILSRCQRYDFKLLPTQRIRDRIEYILGEEKIEHDDAAVALVAREAAGSMRDALSLLDQVIAGMHGTLTGADAARLLGVAESKVLYDLARQVLGGDAVGALRTVHAVTQQGYDLLAVARDFLALLRNLVVSRVVPDAAELLDLADEERGDVEAIARAAEVVDLERLFAAWSRTVDEAARAREPRWVLEMSLVRLAHRPTLAPVDELIARLGEMEKRLGGGGAGPAGPQGGAPRGGSSGAPIGAASGGSAGATQAGAVSASPATGSGPRASAEAALVARGGASSERALVGASATPSTVGASGVGGVNGRGDPSAAAPMRALGATSAGAPLATMASMAARSVMNASAVAVPTTPAVPVASGTPGALAPGRAPSAARVNPTVHEGAPSATSPGGGANAAGEAAVLETAGAQENLAAWERVLARVENVPTRGLLQNAVPLVLTRERVQIALEQGSFYARRAASAEVQAAIVGAVEAELGARPTVEVLEALLGDDAPTLARRDEKARQAERARREHEARMHPFVQKVLSVLGGEVRAVRLDGES